MRKDFSIVLILSAICFVSAKGNLCENHEKRFTLAQSIIIKQLKSGTKSCHFFSARNLQRFIIWVGKVIYAMVWIEVMSLTTWDPSDRIAWLLGTAMVLETTRREFVGRCTAPQKRNVRFSVSDRPIATVGRSMWPIAVTASSKYLIARWIYLHLLNL